MLDTAVSETLPMLTGLLLQLHEAIREISAVSPRMSEHEIKIMVTVVLSHLP
jgi:hypothetical protein